MKNSRDRIIDVIRKYTADNNEIEKVISGEPILSVLSVDSLSMIHLVNDLENEFETRFDYETIEYVFENIHTLERFLCGESTQTDALKSN